MYQLLICTYLMPMGSGCGISSAVVSFEGKDQAEKVYNNICALPNSGAQWHSVLRLYEE